MLPFWPLSSRAGTRGRAVPPLPLISKASFLENPHGSQLLKNLRLLPRGAQRGPRKVWCVTWGEEQGDREAWESGPTPAQETLPCQSRAVPGTESVHVLRVARCPLSAVRGAGGGGGGALRCL